MNRSFWKVTLSITKHWCHVHVHSVQAKLMLRKWFLEVIWNSSFEFLTTLEETTKSTEDTNEHFCELHHAPQCQQTVLRGSVFHLSWDADILRSKLNVNKVKTDPWQASPSCWSPGSNVLKSVQNHKYVSCPFPLGFNFWNKTMHVRLWQFNEVRARESWQNAERTD